MSEKLKPCPLCQCSSIILELSDCGRPVEADEIPDDGLVADAKAECHDCGLRVNGSPHGVLIYDAADFQHLQQKTAQKWNSLAEISTMRARVAELEKEKQTAWIVGQFIKETPEGAVWDLQGVFANEQLALEACTTPAFFLGPMDINKALPHERCDWPGVYYPGEAGA